MSRCPVCQSRIRCLRLKERVTCGTCSAKLSSEKKYNALYPIFFILGVVAYKIYWPLVAVVSIVGLLTACMTPIALDDDREGE